MSSNVKNTISGRFVEAVYELIKKKIVSSGADLMVSISKPSTSWPNVMNGRQSVTVDMIDQVCSKYHVSPSYLISGELPMYSTDVKELTRDSNHFGEQKFGKSISSMLKILTVPVDLKGNEMVAVVPEFALAGYSESFQDPNFIHDLPIETIPEDLQGRGSIRKFQVYGDSMEPTLMHGDFIYCSYVELQHENDPAQKIRNDYVYVINSTKGLFVKRLYFQIGDSYVTLYSDRQKFSTESRYQPFQIDLQDIQELWYFRRRYTAQVPVPILPDREYLELKNEMFKTQLAIMEIQKKMKKKKV